MYHTCIIHPCFSASLRDTATELEAALDKPLSTEDLVEDLVYELDRKGMEEVRVRKRAERTEVVLGDHILMHWEPGEKVAPVITERMDRLELEDAARAFRWNYRTLQVYIRSGLLKATRGLDGSTFIDRLDLESLAASLQTSARHGMQRLRKSAYTEVRARRGALRIRKQVVPVHVPRPLRRTRLRILRSGRRRGMFSGKRLAAVARRTVEVPSVVLVDRVPDKSTINLVRSAEEEASARHDLLMGSRRVRHRWRGQRPRIRLPVGSG